ncbi:hypothetical protein BM221_007238 [Beauveria bassiana]|uniref:Uncharacterized protein n=1 Tax=Beauveria bassiana TaxID=176275 RepID=A0A2N6NJX3_BEABA|nr:hypothetical protein BM221_007238 [Beauveria bassiana]
MGAGDLPSFLATQLGHETARDGQGPPEKNLPEALALRAGTLKSAHLTDGVAGAKTVSVSSEQALIICI